MNQKNIIKLHNNLTEITDTLNRIKITQPIPKFQLSKLFSGYSSPDKNNLKVNNNNDYNRGILKNKYKYRFTNEMNRNKTDNYDFDKLKQLSIPPSPLSKTCKRILKPPMIVKLSELKYTHKSPRNQRKYSPNKTVQQFNYNNDKPKNELIINDLKDVKDFQEISTENKLENKSEIKERYTKTEDLKRENATPLINQPKYIKIETKQTRSRTPVMNNLLPKSISPNRIRTQKPKYFEISKNVLSNIHDEIDNLGQYVGIEQKKKTELTSKSQVLRLNLNLNKKKKMKEISNTTILNCAEETIYEACDTFRRLDKNGYIYKRIMMEEHRNQQFNDMTLIDYQNTIYNKYNSK